jgi:hypothetical protein
VRDEVVVALVVVTFAALLTVHVTLVYGIAKRASLGRAFVALVVPPLAPVWAVRRGMQARAGAWLLLLVLYVVAKFLAAT